MGESWGRAEDAVGSPEGSSVPQGVAGAKLITPAEETL